PITRFDCVVGQGRPFFDSRTCTCVNNYSNTQDAVENDRKGTDGEKRVECKEKPEDNCKECPIFSGEHSNGRSDPKKLKNKKQGCAKGEPIEPLISRQHIDVCCGPP